MLELKNIKFHLGETQYTVQTEDVDAETTLNTYLREKIHLTGTKRMCLEGGCGTCIVAVEEIVNGKKKTFAVNSCLVSILSCHGWKIHTIEGIGNPIIGYHKIQTTLADNNGSQCGFCSPGMVMNMFALMETGPKTMKEIENSFAGNICRCTGYRPILAGFKKLASDAQDTVVDIEDVKKCENGKCLEKCKDRECASKMKTYCLKLAKSKWVKVYSLKDLFQVLKTSTNYMLVGGNTARGVYRQTPSTILPDLYVDITGVPELTNFKVDAKTLTLGGNISLTKTMEIFTELAKNNIGFAYLSDMVDHIDLVATVPVRNIGTLAGNLMIKHKHNEFPSDIFLLLETFNATFVIVDEDMNEIKSTPKNFLQIDMNKRVLKNIVLNTIDKSYKYATYKIMPRAQNAHAMVNAGFVFKFSNNNVVQSARIVYGGINPKFIHAINTENLVKGKNLFDNNVLQTIFRSLDLELKPNFVLPDPTPEFRKALAIALFYKFVLKFTPQNLATSRNVSGGLILERPLSTGIQEYGTEEKNYPVTKPIIKVEAHAQTTGQAQYIADFADLPNQVYTAFVTAQAMANSYIIGTDATAALKIPGVIAYYDKKDIPGENSFMPKLGNFQVPEELFCSGRVQYYDQPIGIVVANDHDTALKAVEAVKITYSAPKSKPFLDVHQVVEAKATDRIHHQTTVVAKRKGTDIKKVIKGKFYINWQYHYHMEVQCCNVVPTEDGLDIYPSTQWMDLAQLAAAAVLKLPTNKINVFVRRLGGAFGAKISRNSLVSTAAALAAWKLRRPVKMWVPFETNMNVIGKRYPLFVEYEVGVNNQGVIQYLTADLYSDFGVGGNEVVDSLIVPIFENCYDTSTWEFSTYTVTTDTHANCWTRAPGTLEGLGAIESIMEHIACELNLESNAVKEANLLKTKFTKIVDFYENMQTWADIPKRKQEIKQFNTANRWTKKGMSIVPMAWYLDVTGSFSVLVSIFHGDGGVGISHGGIEMGQGINTKVCQVAAYKFGIPLEKVSVKPSYNLIAPNSFMTGGSLTSEAICYAVIQACDKLIKKMAPIKEQMTNPTWEELVNKCFGDNVPLSATGFYSTKEPGVQAYEIYGLCVAEVEVDILTGQKQILQVDIVEDVGDSTSPLIDIGQVEGAFVMGIGYYTTEHIIYNEEGQLTTNRTWTYKPPGAKDIPINFRIKFPDHNPNPVGILHSKAVAEPPICLSVSVPLAIRNAVADARKEADPKASKWFPFDGPTTVEATFLNSLNSYSQYKM